jgi:predicted N-acetyltransferase YhbS
MKNNSKVEPEIRLERSDDATEIDNLHSVTFGPGRYTKSAYRYREKRDHLIDISFVLVDKNQIIGSVRYWEILVNNAPALLLGPIVINPDYRGRGYGAKLIDYSVNKCNEANHNIIILVGDLSYYSKVGFKRMLGKEITFAGPVNNDRVLYREIKTNIIEDSSKIIIKPYPD